MRLNSIAGLVPTRWQVPARYWKRRVLRELEPELAWFLNAVPKGATVFDIGANMGNYTHAARVRGHRVHACEPLPYCAGVLRAYAERHPEVTLHAVAMGDTMGTATLTVPAGAVNGRATLDGQHIRGQSHAITVPVATVDSLAIPQVGGIKIDVEGHEFAVLAGARETIARDHPVMLIELVPEWIGCSTDEARARIERMGYTSDALTPDANTFLFRPRHT